MLQERSINMCRSINRASPNKKAMCNDKFTFIRPIDVAERLILKVNSSKT